jgi:mRNA-degrading endonuclease RelE of RelBE toxin-antitoxin system
MRFTVVLKKSEKKKLSKLPVQIQQRFEALTMTLRDGGPAGPHNWSNYSKLGENKYHCHLSYHYAACWRHEKKTIRIEVYYVGSREDAPY